jgi:osmotically-inducible protein OsmY
MSSKIKIYLSVAAVVALFGTAASMFYKRAAEPVARPITADSTAGLVVNAPSLDSLDAALTRESIAVDRWNPQYVDGILILRGRVNSEAKMARVGDLAKESGFRRVANLLQITKNPDDQAIERDAERALAESRALEGCRFSLDAENGVLHVNGTVQQELQKDAARELLKNIDGVREIRAQFSSL